ncbi:ABC transporter ATP-binding protein [Neisseria subflava]|uniref:ABC transporter ATP-binding protein n=1 Tax=Neisseria subflava TaxID=28449 RepID=A0A9X9N264_NEISU|nr:ABC transporter ATP-binding protein [Neisseria subflava]
MKFDHVDFSYEAGKPLLNGFNLNIKPGEKVGLIGRSGAGKSTTSTCSCAFTNRKAARFRLTAKTWTALPKKVCAPNRLVTQDTSLLHRSVRDNIIYGRPDRPKPK